MPHSSPLVWLVQILDLVPLGFQPLLIHAKLIDPLDIPVELTVQNLYPSFAPGGLEERLVLYGFIAW